MPTRSHAVTDPGRVEKENNDGIYADDTNLVYAVADGVAGPPGEFASRVFLQLVQDHAVQLAEVVRKGHRDADAARGRRDVLQALARLFETANTDIYGWSRENADLRGAATTATLCVLDSAGVFLAHVGDSRAYLARSAEVRQLTCDHTMAEELIRIGQLRREETGSFRYRNVVSQTLGERAVCRPDLVWVDTTPGDTLLLCTDGLTDCVGDRDLGEALQQAGLNRPATKLIDMANHAGGHDNVAAVVVHLLPDVEPKTAVSHIGAPFQHTMKLESLGHLFFCQHLTPDERMKVLRYMLEVQALPGSVIFRQGEQAQDLYLVIQGTLDVLVDGHAVTVVGPGSHFGEIALVSGQPRSATVVAREPARLMRMTRDDFFDLSQRDQAVAVKMLWAFAQTLSGRVTELSKQVAGFKRA